MSALFLASALVALSLFAATPTASAAPAAATAPQFVATTVEGKRLDLRAQLAQGPVVLDFWATWCHPCVQAMPGLQRMHEQYSAAGVTVVGISIDGPRNFARVQPFARQRGVSFAIVRDEDASLQGRFHVTEVPTTIVIAPDGRIAATFTGYRPGQHAQIEAAVQALLAPAGAAADSAR